MLYLYCLCQVREELGRCTCPDQFPLIRKGDGKYQVGEDNGPVIFVRVRRTYLLGGTGGPWTPHCKEYQCLILPSNSTPCERLTPYRPLGGRQSKLSILVTKKVKEKIAIYTSSPHMAVRLAGGGPPTVHRVVG
jgi:hypothetical protein